MRWFVTYLLAPLLAGLMLLGMAGTNSRHLTPEDASDYHARVRVAVDGVPYLVGDWLGRDVPVPVEATNMLRPNALLSRAYFNPRTGQQVSVMLVQTGDARDLVGHYPPECYPASGWSPVSREPVKLPISLEGRTREVEVIHYDFAMSQFTGPKHIEIYNVMILPNGQFSTGMAGLKQISDSYQLRHLGGAAMQFIPDLTMTDEQVLDAWQQFIAALRPAIETIQRGDLKAPSASPASTAATE